MADSTVDSLTAITTPLTTDNMYISASVGDRKITLAYLRAALKEIYATCQTRTQASYIPAAQGVSAMSSALDLSFTQPTGATKNKLDWKVNGENGAAIGFVVYRKVDAGAFTLLPESRNGTVDYWSVITCPLTDLLLDYDTTTTSISIIDNTPPTAGSVVTYRLYVAETNNTGTADFYLNRNRLSAGAANQPAGSSTGEAKCIF